MRGPEDENVDTPALTLLGQGGWHRRLALFILPRLQRGPTVADEPNETILTMLRALDAKVDRLVGDVEVVKGKIDAWPDLNFLQAVAQRQLSEAREAREFRRYVEIKLDEIYGSMATSSEIAKLRQEVANSIDREDGLDLRISAIEIRLGIKNPLAPE